MICPEHEGLKSTVEALDGALKIFGDWKIRDDYRQDITEEFVQEIKTQLLSIENMLHEIRIAQKDYATWKAHDHLKGKMSEQFKELRGEMDKKDYEMRKFIISMMTIGIGGASIVVSLIQHFIF